MATSRVAMYCNWATLDLVPDPTNSLAYIEDPDLIARTFTILPSERAGGDVKSERLEILDRIVTRSNEYIPVDAPAMGMISKLGSNLIINSLACNLKTIDINGSSVPNRTVAFTNHLNTRLFERMSMTRPEDGPNDKKFIITSTVLSQEKYGEPLRKFKARLGLDPDDLTDLTVLCSTSMSPFPTAHNFV
ncbi:hypothetical protein F5I97DRAFT_1829492 [Phlebopus sp. FC_14]|nr:hypothetical protein F5I97DRAFT_1829492 [Phlebopus sp. FC_14]